ncbi:RDD family protein [Streptomyces hoynatensis]|uniref:RDD family protein n=1 Tax=Streptomyces hoynatensis TaxID=1141874 RepID=A0A3A9YMD7_9ACTN|nr:RDD family protein [Streptomyces hoynatensis]RKN37425.1 RDD family protein [Streptomyces hoynatensis]
MSRVVTGDAVVLGLQPARLPSRAMAVVFDLVVLLAGYLALSVVLQSTVLPLGSAAALAVQAALLMLVLVGVPVAVETLSRGRSLGKLAFGLRVVREDGGPIRFRHALVRGAVGFLEILATLGSVACLASLVSAQGRRLGDVFAGALVVRERLPGAGRALAPSPGVAAGVAAGGLADLDLSQVPEPLWLAVRQYLARAWQLDRRVSWSMAVTLANDVAARIGAPPPGGLHPAEYLAAVAAERQRREAGRSAAFGGAPAAPAPWAPAAGHGPAAVPAEPVASGGFAAPGGPPPGGSISAAGPAPGGRPPSVGPALPEGPPVRRTGFIPPA